MLKVGARIEDEEIFTHLLLDRRGIGRKPSWDGKGFQ